VRRTANGERRTKVNETFLLRRRCRNIQPAWQRQCFDQFICPDLKKDISQSLLIGFLLCTKPDDPRHPTIAFAVTRHARAGIRRLIDNQFCRRLEICAKVSNPCAKGSRRSLLLRKCHEALSPRQPSPAKPARKLRHNQAGRLHCLHHRQPPLIH
jgi:hypothetical protein